MITKCSHKIDLIMSEPHCVKFLFTNLLHGASFDFLTSDE